MRQIYVYYKLTVETEQVSNVTTFLKYIREITSSFVTRNKNILIKVFLGLLSIYENFAIAYEHIYCVKSQKKADLIYIAVEA